MAILIKVISLIFALLVVSKTYYDYKKKQESLFSFLFWTFAWLVIVYVAFFPQRVFLYFQKMADQNIGIGTLTGIAFVFLFFVTYRIYVKANRLEQKIKDMVIRIGLKDLEKK